jgi:hypothetical protein
MLQKDWLRKINWVRVVRMHVRCQLKQHTGAYIAISRLRYRKYESAMGINMIYTSPLQKDTEIVIEGPHRCGNTFSVVAFHLAQDRPVKVAHHLHAAAQVIEATKRGIPSIVLVREPEEAVVSHVATFPCPMQLALREYVLFYSQLLPYKDRVVTAQFEEVTGDFGAVIRSVNERYGTRFRPFEHNEENVARCVGVINDYYRLFEGKDSEKKVARPSAERSRNKEEVRAQFHSEEFAALRAEAYRVYEMMS